MKSMIIRLVLCARQHVTGHMSWLSIHLGIWRHGCGVSATWRVKAIRERGLFVCFYLELKVCEKKLWLA